MGVYRARLIRKFALIALVSCIPTIGNWLFPRTAEATCFYPTSQVTRYYVCCVGPCNTNNPEGYMCLTGECSRDCDGTFVCWGYQIGVEVTHIEQCDAICE